jgi:hypothetical protein
MESETEPTAHTLTLLFHRFLSPREWQDVIEHVQTTTPYVVELRADAVYEPPEQIFTDGWNPLVQRKMQRGE